MPRSRPRFLPEKPPTPNPERRDAARSRTDVPAGRTGPTSGPADPTVGLQQHFLATVLLLTTVAFIAILLPFYGALMWGAIIGLLFAPLFNGLCRRFGGRTTWAAVATMGLVLVIVVLPFLLIAGSLAQEGARLVQGIKGGQIDFAAYVQKVVAWLPESVRNLLDRFGLGNAAAIQERVGQGAGKVGQFFANQLLDIGQGTFNAVVSFFIALYVAFFMLRDGSSLAARIESVLPMPRPDKATLSRTFATVVRATVKGNLVVALVQGTLGGVALAVLGVQGALLLGALMCFAALLPSVGAALIWGPVALYLLATGSVWQGVSLIVFGTLVIGLVDNILRPLLVGKDTQLPDWLVLLATIGGISLIGINGFVVGPVVAAMFVAVWALVGQKATQQEAVSTSAPPAGGSRWTDGARRAARTPDE